MRFFRAKGYTFLTALQVSSMTVATSSSVTSRPLKVLMRDMSSVSTMVHPTFTGTMNWPLRMATLAPITFPEISGGSK